jgi:hypothetical protein
MKHVEQRPFASPEAAARKLLELAAGVAPINSRIHIEKVNAPFMSQDGCRGSGPEFGAGIKYAIEHGWLEQHESGTYVRLLPPGEALFLGADGMKSWRERGAEPSSGTNRPTST